jgi:hypothetical protein
MSQKLPRGVRNHNPSNIDHVAANKWQGLADPPSDGRFCIFKSEVWGLRALAVLLIRYFDRYECDTVSKVINRWAPPVENDTGAYAAAVAKRLGRGPHDPINLHDYKDLLPLMKGIVTHENGDPKKFGKPADWYPQETYGEALRRAGVVPIARKKVNGADVAQGAAAASISVAAVWEVGSKMIDNASPNVQMFGAIALFVAMLVSVLAWWRHNKSRKAERL